MQIIKYIGKTKLYLQGQKKTAPVPVGRACRIAQTPASFLKPGRSKNNQL